MGKNIDDIIGRLPAERQAKIQAGAQAKIEAMMREAETLGDVRRAFDKTQAQLAYELGIGQNAVSQMEKRSDIYVSTLRRVLKTLGLHLEMSVVSKAGVRIELPRLFGALNAEPSTRMVSPRPNATRFARPTTLAKQAAARGPMRARKAIKQAAPSKRVANAVKATASAPNARRSIKAQSASTPRKT